MQLTLIFQTDPDRYSTDPAKIAFAASYLNGSTKEWFKPHVDLVIGTTPSFPTWASFTQALKAVFDDPDAYQTQKKKYINSNKANGTVQNIIPNSLPMQPSLNGVKEPRSPFSRKASKRNYKSFCLPIPTPPESSLNMYPLLLNWTTTSGHTSNENT